MKLKFQIQLLSALLGVMLFSGCQPNTVYFASPYARTIEHMPTTGGQPKVLVPEVAMAMGLACPRTKGQIYLAQQGAINLWDNGKWITVTETQTANCVALDEKAGRVYWGDAGRRHVASCNLKGGDLRVLVCNVDFPHAIAVNPSRGLLYWGQQAPERGVWMSRLDGTERRRISDEGILPRALAVDTRSGRIFWARPEYASFPARIVSSNYDGTDTKVIASLKNRFIEGLAVDEASRQLIWSERIGNNQADIAPALIRSANFDGTSVKTIHGFSGNHFAQAVTIGPPGK